jgi:formylmethanofuran dehydrogenase subunit C
MIRFALRGEPPCRLDMSALIPERIAGLSLAEIERLPLSLDKRPEALGAWFAVTPGDRAIIEISGPCDRLDRIAAGMAQGEVIVRGDAGAYLGLSMRGGRVIVDGSAGYGVATDLSGGEIHVRGDVGDELGGSLPGAGSGMRGGFVRVDGGAGGRAARGLRRGLLLVAGDVGAGCGAGMIAGTVIVGGALGSHAGLAMRRGSIIALSGAEMIPPSFADTGTHDLLILRMLARHLAARGLPDWAERVSRMRRLVGDQAIGGKGEIMIPP